MDEVFYSRVEGMCEREEGHRVKASRPFKLVRDVRGQLRMADLPPALDCLETDECALKRVACLQAVYKRPEADGDVSPNEIKQYQDYLRPMTEEKEGG